ncbi:MAG: hypothetical protein O9328_09275 [Rhodobacteraceae bacterium]|nr:hypothetical protein [Paracoccaceae bacterium]
MGCDILFVSHLTAAEQWALPGMDTYFGSLPQQLRGFGHRVRIALIDHTATPFADFPTRPDAAVDLPRTLLPRRLDRAEEAAIANRLAAVAADLRAGSGHADLRRLAARQAAQGPARQSLRIATAIARLAARHRPRALVLTYEGHAWERMAMRLSRQAVPGLRCLAVHHAILAPMQQAMATRYGALVDPDVILAAGRAAFDWLSQAPGLRGLPIDLLGSPRARPAAPAPTGPKDGMGVLFLPEGMLSESTRLALAAYALAAARPDLTCTIRLHPLTSRAALAAAEPRLRLSPPNVDWSPPDRPLDEDARRATWAVYRGSSAVLSAMAAGAVPVYLGDEPAELRIDPLRGAGAIVQIVPRTEDLAEALQAQEIRTERLRDGWAYAQSYYTPMDPEALLRHMIKVATPSPPVQDTP